LSRRAFAGERPAGSFRAASAFITASLLAVVAPAEAGAGEPDVEKQTGGYLG
jgi:hypothetical protein